MKADFLELLKETTELDRHSRWTDVKKKLDSDPRYKAVDSSTRREDWFKDYVRAIEKVNLETLSLFFFRLDLTMHRTNGLLDLLTDYEANRPTE